MRNRKWFQACMAGVLSAAMLMTNVSVWGAEFSDGSEVPEIVSETEEVSVLSDGDIAVVAEEEAPVIEDDEFTAEAAEASEVAINSKSFPDAVFRDYVLNQIDTNRDKKLSATERKAVEELKLVNMGIKDMRGVNYFSYLTTLSVANNNLKKIDLTRNTRLQNINLSGNNLGGTLDLRKCTRMKTINVSDNALTKIALPSVKYLKKVEMINVSKNKFTSQINAGLHPNNINSSAMPNLIEIYASDNAFTSFNCNGYAGMILDLRNNKITRFGGGNGGFQAIGYYLDGNSLKSTSKIDFSALGNVVPQRFSCDPGVRSKVVMITPKLSATADCTKAELAVGSSYPDASYKLEKKNANGSYTTIKTWEAGELYDPEFGENEYTDYDITAGNSYTYRVTATVEVQNADRVSVEWSKSLEKTVKAVPAVPSVSVKSAKKGEAAISWKEVPDADGYLVYYGTRSNKLKRIATTSNLTYTKNRLSSKRTYYFSVRAYKKVNGKNVYGALSKARGVKIR